MKSIGTMTGMVITAWAIAAASVLTAPNPQRPPEADAQHDHSHDAATAPAGAANDEMSRMHQMMMGEMNAASARLDVLLKDVNAAKGEARLTALTAVVTELVQQQKTMQQHMAMMHGQMMPTMMGRGAMMKKD